MERRRKNNIIIGTLCAILVLMGVGYAILSATLNIGGTANITGDFDIHFLNDDQNKKGISLIDYDNSTSGNTIYNTTVNNTIAAQMESVTEVDSQDSTNATFSAILQKPTDYAIFTVTVKNYGTIDGYLTFSFEDTNSNFDYYDDFYSVEFIRDDINPAISTDILQPNASFSDPQVLVNTSGTRTYKIKVTYKSTAESFPDATTNGAFGCTLNLTYSQRAPSGGNSGGNEQQLTSNWYSGTVTNDVDFEGKIFAVNLQDEQNGTKSIVHYMVGEQDVAPMFQQDGISFVPYDSNITFTENYLGLTPTTGDYVVVDDDTLMCVLRGDVIYTQIEPRSGSAVQQLSLTPNASLSDFINN